VRGIDVNDLIGQPGSSRTVRLDEPVAGLELELARVRGDVPIQGDLLLESVVEGILVSGHITGEMSLSCARCLKSFAGELAVDVAELYVVGARPGDDEYALDPSGEIDPEPMIRDAMMLELPFSPLCRPDCRGLCEICGRDRNAGACTCAPRSADPRWAALEEIRFD
jgi:uncharacterized protein